MVWISKGRLKDFIRLLRPHFLLGSVMLFMIGVTYAGGVINLTFGLVLAIIAAVMVQLACQLADDYFDREGDRPSQRSLFAGGSGVIQSGSFSAQTVLRMTILTCAASLFLATIVVVIAGRWLFLPLIVFGLVGGLTYSAPPVRMASTRSGELSVALLIGFVLPLTGWYFVKGTMDLGILVICVPLFLFTLQSLVAVQFPDMEADRASGKRNVTFRLGIDRSKYVQTSILLIGYLAVIVEVAIGSLRIGALLVLVTVPLSLYSTEKLIRMKDYDFNVAKSASNVAMMVNGISMAIMLIYVTFQTI